MLIALPVNTYQPNLIHNWQCLITYRNYEVKQAAEAIVTSQKVEPLNYISSQNLGSIYTFSPPYKSKMGRGRPLVGGGCEAGR